MHQTSEIISCSECDDIGVIEKNGKLFECECALVRRISASMPPYIRKAEILPAHLELGFFNKINKSLYVISSWPDTKSIIKACIIKFNKKYFRITSDREIRDVYVGSRSSAASSDQEKVLNTLEDLMDPPDLVVVRLNELSYKNKAAPGALEEAISYRCDRDKPTWLISDIDRVFGVGSHAYSESVWNLINDAFEITKIPMILPRTVTNVDSVVPVQFEQKHNEQQLKEKETKSDEKPAKINRISNEELTGGLSMYGSGFDRLKPKSKLRK
jgi:hypothetical protein